ncbi:MAG: hypothetical protein OXQ90_06160 [Gammaproteobacteria bacterium]|nr:hypothetical protein [Gammaproteobacteria bacterium]
MRDQYTPESRCTGCSIGNSLLWALPIVLVVGCGGSGGSSAGSLPAAAIRLVSAESTMVEGGELVFDLELRPAPGSAVTVRYAIEDEADVTDANGGVVSVGASGDATIRLGIIDDDEIEAPREALTVELVAGNNTGYVLGSAATVTVEIEEGVCDRTPQIRDRLVSVTRVDRCADVTGENLTDIGDFYTGRLSTVQKDDLMGLSGLHLLGVCWHEAERYAPRGTLATLPEGFFDHVPGMLELSISGCAITELPDNILSSMPNLDNFFLSEPVTRLPDFSANTRLKALTVDRTALTQLPADAFAIPQLEVLYLQTNERLGNVAAEAFRGLPELTHLSLINSPVAQVPVDLLSHLPALTWLQLANADLSTLPEGFALPRGLTFLNLNENPFSLLPTGLFDDLPELTDLRISYAAALHIPPGMFRNLTALEKLSLIRSGIRDLPTGVFSGLRDLNSVWLEGNELTSLPEGLFDDLVSLEAISLNGNPGTPFAVEVGLERIDGSFTAGSPARIRLKADAGFPITDTVPISTVNGSASVDSVQFERGASSGPEVVVTQGSRASATHVAIGPLSTSTTPSLAGIELRIGEPIALFRETPHRMPVPRRTPALRKLQVDGGHTTVLLDKCFADHEPLTFTGQAANRDVVRVVPATAGVVLEPVAEGKTTVSLTATDPEGLSVSQDLAVVVEPPPDRSGFHIDIDYVGGVEERIRRITDDAAARWMSIVTGDLPEVSVAASMDCTNVNRVFTGLVDDLRVKVRVNLNRPGTAVGIIESREGSLLPYISSIVIGTAAKREDEDLERIMLHEFAHTLGFGFNSANGLFHNSSRVFGPGADTHFSGPLAIEAFDDAGGTRFTERSKVPLHNGGFSNSDSHWAFSELMDVGATGPLSAVTIQLFADLGYEVDVTQAEEFELKSEFLD